MTGDGEDRKPILSRWSERKLKARAGEAEPPELQRSEDAAPRDAESESELEANRAAAEAIDLDTLTDRSDYSPFFRAGVPAALQSAALRKLWRSNPVFAVLDGLNDYDGDYTWPKSGGDVVQTAWKIGRGFLADDDRDTAKKEVAKPSVEDPGDAPEAGAGKGEAAATDEPAAPPLPEPETVASEGDDGEAAPERPEPPKVGLARRLDLDAFARAKGEG